VSDIERAAQFYIDAFEGHYVVCPFAIKGDFAEVVMDGPPGVSFKVAMVGFAHGCVELFEFIEPVNPSEPVHPTRGNIIHFGVQVDNVAETLGRVEAAGGRRLWPEINPWGSANVIYVTDPDQNILEVTNASMQEIIRLTLEAYPAADPANQEARA